MEVYRMARLFVYRNEFKPDEFGLVRHWYDGEDTSMELVAIGDNYALCDYWATMFNVGKNTLAECAENLARGAEGIPSNAERARQAEEDQRRRQEALDKPLDS